MAAPKEHIKGYPSNKLPEEMHFDSTTFRAVKYIKSEPMTKAVITGHLHMNYEGS